MGHHGALAPPGHRHRVGVTSKLGNGLLHPVQGQAQVSQTQVTGQRLGLVREKPEEAGPGIDDIKETFSSKYLLSTTDLYSTVTTTSSSLISLAPPRLPASSGIKKITGKICLQAS